MQEAISDVFVDNDESYILCSWLTKAKVSSTRFLINLKPLLFIKQKPHESSSTTLNNKIINFAESYCLEFGESYYGRIFQSWWLWKNSSNILQAQRLLSTNNNFPLLQIGIWSCLSRKYVKTWSTFTWKRKKVTKMYAKYM